MNRTQLMREYVSAQLRGYSVAALSTSQLEAMIDGYYVGGLDQWSIDYTGRPARSDETTQMRLRAAYQTHTRRRLTPSQTIISLSVDPATGNVLVALETLSVREGVTRDSVTGRTLALCVYSGSREIERIEAPDPDFEPCSEVGQYTRVNTPERFVQTMSQWLTCYRPGTDTSPMDGCYGPTRKDALLAERMKFRELTRQLGVRL